MGMIKRIRLKRRYKRIRETRRKVREQKVINEQVEE